MNDQDKRLLIEHKLAKAHTTLEEAKLLIDNKYWNAAVNRLYYACFYAVGALLVSKDLETKTHAGVRQMFGLHFVTTGKIENASAKFYSEIFGKRQSGDYEDMIEYEEGDVVALVEPAKKLIEEIEHILL
jgi:uncharacterized protein (UPF0332 family)